ncbi:MAG: molybdenum ABC transporter ATP-binding protein [Verrucomicrobiaceae bacterium]|nr:molybdenum ABC transporter ATP-binding protein [Verrucomicrobiaceae bacterium]
MRTPVLELEDVTVWRGQNKVFDGLSLQVYSGERVAILGPNGAGKSTLLALISGDVHPVANQGSSKLFGEEYWSLYDLRDRIGLITPEQRGLFDDDELASDVVLTGLHGTYGITRGQTFTASEKRRAWKAMKAAGVHELMWRDYGELSSGERRRFLLARALVHDPEMLIFDEPTTSLDLPGAWNLIDSVRGLMRTGTGVLLVTHDVREIPPEVDRVVLMKKGRILADGTKRRLLTESLLSECYGMAMRVGWREGFCEVRPG